jgi:hypothetical protein
VVNGPLLARAGTETYTCSKGPDPKTSAWGTYPATVQDGSDAMNYGRCKSMAAARNRVCVERE